MSRTISALLPLWVASLATAAEPVAPSVANKPYVLFAGSDIAVLLENEYRPLVGAGAYSFIVKVDRQTRELARDRAKDVRVTPSVKLTRTNARIEKLRGILTSDAASREQFASMQASMANADAADALRDRAQGELMLSDMSASALDHMRSPIDDPTFAQRYLERIHREAYDKFEQARVIAAKQQSVSQDMLVQAATAAPNATEEVIVTPEVTPSSASAATMGKAPASETAGKIVASAPPNLVAAANGICDRLDMEFEISTPQRLEKAYAVLITDFVIPKKPGHFRRVSAQRLGTIDPKPRKVTIEQTNFPTGFSVTNYRVALYVNGQEIATNLIENQAALSEDEAYAYLVDNYIASHKDQTRAPAAMLMGPRSNVKITDAAAIRQPVYVTVDASGKITSVSTDRTEQKEPPSGVHETLRSFRFIPALDKGTPTTGRAKLVIAEFLE